MDSVTPERIAVEAQAARRFAVDLLVHAGAPDGTAEIVADHLVESSRRGVHSHGVIRLAQYLREIDQGLVDPRAPPTVARDDGVRVVVDGNGAFGQLGGVFMAETAIERAESQGAAVVSLRHVSHTGRLGAYVELAAERGHFGLLFAAGTGLEGRWVAPAGGRSRRLSTNPLAYAFPSADGAVVADFATSTAPEGVIRSLWQRGLPSPPDTLIDVDGTPTTDPGVLYADPPGAILPLGGARFGHKGSAIGLLVEVMASIVPGEEYDAADHPSNTMTMIVLRLDPEFAARATRLGRYIRSARPLVDDRPVMLPGDPERTARSRSAHVLFDTPVWKDLRALGERAGVVVPEADGTPDPASGAERPIGHDTALT